MRHADDLPHEPDAAHRRRPTPITVPLSAAIEASAVVAAAPAQQVALTAHGHAVSGGSAMLLSAVALTAHGHAVSSGTATLS
jgi:hypothetical protein